jgi:putative oxidoreductase
LLTWLNRFQPFGTLAMRLVLGAIMVAYGYRKIIPHGALHNFVRQVGHLGLPSWLGYVAAYTEFVGGMLLIVGLLTRIVAFAVLIDMIVAFAKVGLPGGLNGPGSFPLPLACLALALMLVTTGAGPLALDNLAGMGGGGGRRKSGAR